jgi:hypothetical protein
MSALVGLLEEAKTPTAATRQLFSLSATSGVRVLPYREPSVIPVILFPTAPLASLHEEKGKYI